MSWLGNSAIIGIVLVLSGCGKSPVGPSPVVPSGNISGTVLSYPGDQPVAGAKIIGDGNPINVETDENGRFIISAGKGLQSANRVKITASGHIDYTTGISGNTQSDNAMIRLIRNQLPFRQDFYGLFARNGSSGALGPLNIQPGPFSVYIKTTDQDGNEVPSATLNMIADEISRTASLFSGGRNLVTGITMGSADKN
jgi:hypothetical protein